MPWIALGPGSSLNSGTLLVVQRQVGGSLSDDKRESHDPGQGM